MPELTPDELEQLPPELKAILIASQEKIRQEEEMQAQLRAAQKNPDISDDALNAMKVRLQHQTAPELPEVFSVGGESAETARIRQQSRAIIPIAALITVRMAFRSIWILVLLILVLIGVMLTEQYILRHRETMLIDGDTLQYRGMRWKWQDITELRFLAFGRIRLYAEDQTVCTFSRSELHVDRLILDAKRHGITIAGEDL